MNEHRDEATIGKLASHANVGVETARFYQRSVEPGSCPIIEVFESEASIIGK
jgi:hypothetical protein